LLAAQVDALFLDLHAECRQVLVGVQAMDELRDEARLAHAEGPKQTDLFLDHDCPPRSTVSGRRTRSDTQRFCAFSTSVSPTTIGDEVPVPIAEKSSALRGVVRINLSTVSARA